MIHGVVRDGAIKLLEPIPAEWDDGRQVVIDIAPGVTDEERAEIERWYANLEALGPAQYEPGEREAIEKMMAEADREAKEYVRRSWDRLDGSVSAGHESPQRGPERR